jgi:hypothetical protein
LGTAPWKSKLELRHSCVPKLELGNKKGEGSWSLGTRRKSKLELRHSCVPKLELGNKKGEGSWSLGTRWMVELGNKMEAVARHDRSGSYGLPRKIPRDTYDRSTA